MVISINISLQKYLKDILSDEEINLKLQEVEEQAMGHITYKGKVKVSGRKYDEQTERMVEALEVVK